MDSIAAELPKLVCFLCLKCVERKAEMDLSRITSKHRKKTKPVYEKLFEFAENHLKFRDRELVAYLKKSSGVAKFAFCQHCDIFISVVCDLYEEMCRVAEKLAERVEQLADFLEMSNTKKEPTETTGVLPNEIEDFRLKLADHCRVKSKDHSSPSFNDCEDKSQSSSSNIPIENECREGNSGSIQNNDEKGNAMGGDESIEIKVETTTLSEEDEESNESEDSEKSYRKDMASSSLAEEDSDSDLDELGGDNERNDPSFDWNSRSSGSEDEDTSSASRDGSDSDWENGAKKSSTKPQKSSSSPQRNKSNDKKRPYSCDICGLGITRSNYVAVHKEKKHNIPRPPPSERPYSCEICSNNFKSTGTLRNHMIRIHNRKVSFRNAAQRKRKMAPSEITEASSHLQETETTSSKRTSKIAKVTKKDSNVREVKKTQTVSLPGADGTFTCEHCQRICKTRKGISKHLFDVHGIDTADIIRPYGCDLCGQKFTRKENVKAHKKLRHKIRPPARDNQNICDSESKTSDPKECADFQCSECNMEFRTRRQLTYHMYETHKRDKKSLSFMSRVVRAKENGADDIIKDPCVICGEHIKSWALLRKHLEKHEKEIADEKKSHKCFFCWKSFAHEQSIWAHLRSSQYHDFTKIEFPCDHVDHLGLSQWAYQSLGELEKHFQTDHGDSRVLTCTDCGWICLDNNMMDLHRLVHLPRVKSKHQCPVCQNFFLLAETLRNHYNTAHGVSLKLYRCHICTWGFPTKNGLTLHVKTHGDGGVVNGAELLAGKQEEFLCSECPKSYPTAIQLRDHRRCLHVMRQCQECGITIPKVQLYLHMSKVHGGERRHLCQSCGKRFRTPGGLRKHMASHGEFRYACQFCGKGYAVGTLLKRHIRREHKTEDVNQQDISDKNIEDQSAS